MVLQHSSNLLPHPCVHNAPGSPGPRAPHDQGGDPPTCCGGGASGAFPSPFSRSCCPSSSSCLFPAPLFTDPKDLPSSQTGSQNQTPSYSLRLGAHSITQANTSPNSSGTSARPLRDVAWCIRACRAAEPIECSEGECEIDPF